MKIAIVGFGVSGAAVLMSLYTSKKLDKNTEVDLFDPANEPAVGLAYGQDSKRLLLNAFPTAMSLDPRNKLDFSNWLEKHYPEYEARVDLVPRTIFGEYATERLTPLLDRENVAHIQTEIIDATVKKQNQTPTYLLKDADGQEHGAYDAVFFALGNPPYKDFYGLAGTENYIHDPYPVVEKLKAIKDDQKVAIIGSNLTAFDLVNYLSHEKDLKQPIGIFTIVPVFNSLRVQPYQGPALKYSLDREWIDREISLNHGVIPLERIIETVALDLEENAIDLSAIRSQYDPADLPGTFRAYFEKEHPELSKLQGYIARLSGHLGDLYMALSQSDQSRYHLEVAPIFSHYQVRLAPDAVNNMVDLWSKDELFVVPDLKEISKEEKFQLQSDSGEIFDADVVINASGFDFNTDHVRAHSPLMANLLDKGFFLAKDKRGILVSWPESQVLNQRYGQLPNCFVIGPWISNTHLGNNNVKALVDKAYEIVTHYLDR